MKYDKVLGKIEECDSYVKRLIPPPKPADVTKKICQYCDYKSLCRKAGA
jgi:CRISPR/Cas system-associated exonuclease Cas4 (RecB family)